MQGAELRAIERSTRMARVRSAGRDGDATLSDLIRTYPATLIIVVPLDFLFLGLIAKGFFASGATE